MERIMSDSEVPDADSPSGEVVLAPGAVPIPGFRLEHRLGRGGFGEVWRADGPAGAVALKFIYLGDKGARVELRALELMKGIRHPHLLDALGAWERGGFLIQ